MLIHTPCIITPRLLPGLSIGGGFISIEYAEQRRNHNRTSYRWFIDLPDGQEFSEADLASGCQGGTLQEGLGTLLCFLTAAAEGYAYEQRNGGESENSALFPLPVVEWAHQHSEELSMIQYELEEADEETGEIPVVIDETDGPAISSRRFGRGYEYETE